MSSFELPKELRDEWSFGKDIKRPICICASVNARGFGDFAARLFYVNTVAAQFNHSQISLIYRDDEYFKADLVRLLPAAMLVRVPQTQPLPSLDLLNPNNELRFKGAGNWFEWGLNSQDLVITEGMATEVGLQGFELLGYLRFPEDAVESCGVELIKRGLDPNRWFCTVHGREPGFGRLRKTAYHRDCDPQTFMEASRFIVEELGGQVVRLGHPSMTPYPPIKGLIDLSREDQNSLLQLFSISRSRFLLCGPSGPMSIGDALHIPVAFANAMSWNFVNDKAVVRTVDVRMPDGILLNQQRLAQSGYFLQDLIKMGGEVAQNSAQELTRLSTYMFQNTQDTLGWRVPAQPYSGPRPNQLTWPGVLKPRVCFLPT